MLVLLKVLQEVMQADLMNTINMEDLLVQDQIKGLMRMLPEICFYIQNRSGILSF
jgi:hypothetical protein